MIRSEYDELKVWYKKENDAMYAAFYAKILELVEKTEPEKKTGWERPKTKDQAYYTIEGNCVHATLCGMEAEHAPGVDMAYVGANCFTDRALAERIAKQQTVLRLLQRFSDEHGGQEIGKTTAQAWYIAYGKVLDFSKEKDGRVPAIKELYAHSGSPGQGVVPGVVLFATEKVCQQAIEKYGNQIKDAWGLEG